MVGVGNTRGIPCTGAEIERQLRPLVEAASKGDKKAVEAQVAMHKTTKIIIAKCFISVPPN
jgi:hypothetical protein